MKIITLKDLQDPKQAHLFPWIEHQALAKGVSLDKLPIDDEVKEWFKGYMKDKEEAMNERLRGW
jgi:hypothetical protein